jgi:hypothetical protein
MRASSNPRGWTHETSYVKVCHAEVQCDKCAPAKRDRPDVVIPVWEHDLCKLKVTAKSIVAHDPDGVLGKVFVCWVSHAPRSEFARQLNEITHILKEHGEVEVLELQLNGMMGWLAQQSAKLKAASVVSSEYYVVLDAKNSLLRDIESDDLFTPCNQAKVFGRYSVDAMPGGAGIWYRASAGALGQQAMDWGVWPASITPMVMHRQTTLDMLKMIGESPGIDSICAGGLCGMLSGHATEFTLYLVYAARIASFDCIHAIEERPWGEELSATIWRGPHDLTSEQVRNLAERSGINGNLLFFGAQAGALDGWQGTERSDILNDLSTVYKNASLYDWDNWEDMAGCIVGGSR